MAAHRVQWFKALPPLVGDELSRGSLCHSERLWLELIESSSQPARALKLISTCSSTKGVPQRALPLAGRSFQLMMTLTLFHN